MLEHCDRAGCLSDLKGQVVEALGIVFDFQRVSFFAGPTFYSTFSSTSPLVAGSTEHMLPEYHHPPRAVPAALRHRPRHPFVSARDDFRDLTERQREVIHLITEASATPRSPRFSVSPRTASRSTSRASSPSPVALRGWSWLSWRGPVSGPGAQRAWLGMVATPDWCWPMTLQRSEATDDDRQAQAQRQCAAA